MEDLVWKLNFSSPLRRKTKTNWWPIGGSSWPELNFLSLCSKIWSQCENYINFRSQIMLLILNLRGTSNKGYTPSTDWVEHLNQRKTCFLLPLNKQRDWNILSRFDSLEKIWLSLWVSKVAIKIAFNCRSADLSE